MSLRDAIEYIQERIILKENTERSDPVSVLDFVVVKPSIYLGIENMTVSARL